MDEYADIYYIDSNRNAAVRRLPMRSPVIGGRPMYVPPPTASAPVATPIAAPVVYNSPPPVVYGTATPVYTQPPVTGQPPTAVQSLLGRVTAGQLIEMVAQVFAALQALPAAPIAGDDTNTNVSNLILYQGALANHAKRDEQVRTIGNLVSRLVG
ncbi:MAG: hypothetical protein R3B48_18460 [Kofleriaceae bacterium]